MCTAVVQHCCCVFFMLFYVSCLCTAPGMLFLPAVRCARYPLMHPRGMLQHEWQHMGQTHRSVTSVISAVHIHGPGMDTHSGRKKGVVNVAKEYPRAFSSLGTHHSITLTIPSPHHHLPSSHNSSPCASSMASSTDSSAYAQCVQCVPP